MSPDPPGSSFDPRRHRVELVEVDVEAPGDGPGRVSVRLRAGSSETTADRSGPPDAGSLNRLAAEATLEALRQLVPEMPRLRLTSVDRVLGGGSDVLLVVAEAPAIADRPLAGAIPVVGANPQHAAASAALDAVNRIVGR